MVRHRIATFLVAIALMGCGTTAPSGVPATGATPGAGLSRSQAYADAVKAAGATGVVNGRVIRIGDLDPKWGLSGSGWVWAVVVSGSFDLSCGPVPTAGATHSPCPTPAPRETVVLDYRTGKFVTAVIEGH
jgi:hypothetical protein